MEVWDKSYDAPISSNCASHLGPEHLFSVSCFFAHQDTLQSTCNNLALVLGEKHIIEVWDISPDASISSI